MTWWTALAVMTIVIGVPLNLYVSVMLWRLHRQAPGIKVLRERGITATLVLIAASVFGVIFLFNDKILLIPFLDSDATKLITRGIILALAVIPASYWLWIYRDS